MHRERYLKEYGDKKQRHPISMFYALEQSACTRIVPLLLMVPFTGGAYEYMYLQCDEIDGLKEVALLSVGRASCSGEPLEAS